MKMFSMPELEILTKRFQREKIKFKVKVKPKSCPKPVKFKESRYYKKL